MLPKLHTSLPAPSMALTCRTPEGRERPYIGALRRHERVALTAVLPRSTGAGAVVLRIFADGSSALIPAAEISEQLSLAGKEASGTGCMKLMLNGALTIGTLDGANIEMLGAVGKDNIFIFGLTSSEVADLWLAGYNSALYYARNDRLHRIVDRLNTGFAGESFSDIVQYLISGHGIADPNMCLADFESYHQAQERAFAAFADREDWSRRSLINIAKGGHFAADRAVKEYADRIWHIHSLAGRATGK